jgi:hypothetical protein
MCFTRVCKYLNISVSKEELQSQRKKTFLPVPDSFGGDSKEMASFSFPSSTRRETKAMRASTSSCNVSRTETKSSLEPKNMKINNKKKKEKKGKNSGKKK